MFTVHLLSIVSGTTSMTIIISIIIISVVVGFIIVIAVIFGVVVFKCKKGGDVFVKKRSEKYYWK